MSDEDVAVDDGVAVNPVAFQEILAPADPAGGAAGVGNLDLILDVSVPVTVCLGSVQKTISEVLSMSEGHVLELDRAAGEPVDLMVNGKLVARGEVVVVENRYGMRITEIVDPDQRLST